uniref:Uncharacterized protein n=1 Tax=Arundo donax TaxID=35708 RepID=A0A0A8ZQD1_ARUDO
MKAYALLKCLNAKSKLPYIKKYLFLVENL